MPINPAQACNAEPPALAGAVAGVSTAPSSALGAAILRVALEFLRFLPLGGIALALSFSVYVLLVTAGLHTAPARAIGFTAGASLSLILVSGLAARPVTWRRAASFFALYATTLVVNVLVNEAGLRLLGGRAPLDLFMAWFVATGCSSAANFAGVKLIVFGGARFETRLSFQKLRQSRGGIDMASMPTLIFLQLNELNFQFIQDYADRGLLPNFKRFFDQHGYVETTSETEHHLANPWIQWPTVHTGLDYRDHGVFRLGDIVKTDHPSIYDVLEANGVKVGAMCAFNARNTTRNAAFFVPDPWTRTQVTAPLSVQLINNAFRQVTDDYAKNKISMKSLADLALGGVVNMKWKNLPHYMAEAWRFARGQKWMRAVVGDRLLGEAFLTQCARTRPQYATVFLNGGAHLQHHYMFSSSAYKGESRNPAWIVPQGADPLLDALKLYDDILKQAVRYAETVPGGRVILATGLHQEPHERETFYYRLDNEADFLTRMGIEYKSTYRLMTEDFVVAFEDEAAAKRGEEMLLEIESVGIEPIFYVETGDSAVRTTAVSSRIFHIENRGADLYVQLRPMSKAMPKGAGARRSNTAIDGLDQRVSFAQYKNTHHHGIGYYADSLFAPGELPATFPLRDIFPLVLAAYQIDHPRVRTMDRALADAVFARSPAPALAAA